MSTDADEIRRRHNVVVTGRPGAPVLVLAHGFGCDQNMWRLVLDDLAALCIVVLFDHMGAGRSDMSAWSAQRYSGLDGLRLRRPRHLPGTRTRPLWCDGDYHGGFSAPDIDQLLASLDSKYLGWSGTMTR